MGQWLCRLLLLVCCCGAVPATAVEKLVLNIGFLPPYSSLDGKDFFHPLVAALSQEIGVPIELVVYQGNYEREILNASQGVEDGLTARFGGLEKTYANLVRVPEEMLAIDIMALTTNTSLQIANVSWDGLAPYVVGYVNGWKVIEPHRSKFAGITPVRDIERLITLLAAGRADVAVYERLHAVSQARVQGVSVQVLEPPLTTAKLYMYLHKKHTALVPKLNAALLKLKKEGTYQRLYNAMPPAKP